MDKRLERLYPEVSNETTSLNLLNYRLGNIEKPKYYKDTVIDTNKMAIQLRYAKGGFSQQDRMIRDKRRSFDKAMLYSYQSAWVKKHIYDFEPVMDGERESDPVRALINPNKLKQDYDDKIISIGFENDFRPGDVFEWCNTGTYWLIYLQDLTELAYFRGDIRRCSYEIEWVDQQGEKQRSFIAVRGPVETKINFIQKHNISVDNPNHTLNILMPKTQATVDYFKRYAKLVIETIFEVLLSYYDGTNTINRLMKDAQHYPILVNNYREWLEKYTNIEPRNPHYKNKVLYNLNSIEDYRNSCIDFISGATDNFAIKLFTEITSF